MWNMEKNLRTLSNIFWNKLIFYKINFFFSITFVNCPIIDPESPVKVWLEMFFHSNSMDDVSLSLFSYCVPFLYTFPKMPHDSLWGLNQNFLLASPEVSQNWPQTINMLHMATCIILLKQIIATCDKGCFRK